MTDEKRSMRASMLDRLKGLSGAEVAAQSRRVCEAVLGSGVLSGVGAGVGGRFVAGYMALPAERGAEVDPLGVLRGCSRVALPLVDWSSGVFELRACPGGAWETELVAGRYGLREPPASWPVVGWADVGGVGGVGGVLVPGVAFDRGGRRLGRGAGMYDRFLAALPAGTPTIGLALREQVVERVPVDGHDVRLSAVVTSDGVLTGENPGGAGV